MHKELVKEGHDVVFVGAHGYSARTLEEQAAIYSRMSYPLLQERRDASLRDLWGNQDRHDIYVFAPDGRLLNQIHGTKTAATPTGYAKLKLQLEANLKANP